MDNELLRLALPKAVADEVSGSSSSSPSTSDLSNSNNHVLRPAKRQLFPIQYNSGKPSRPIRVAIDREATANGDVLDEAKQAANQLALAMGVSEREAEELIVRVASLGLSAARIVDSIKAIDEAQDVRPYTRPGRRIFFPGQYNKGKPIKYTAPRVSRNDPCPCGSGKRFKECHRRPKK